MTDRTPQPETTVKGLLDTLWRLARGTLESVRLSAAERLTLLMAAVAVAAVATILGSAIIFFLSIGAAQLLKSLTPDGAYFIVAGFYALLLAVLIIFRRRLVTDPIARMVTRLLVAPPDTHTPTPDETDTPASGHEHSRT
ncbi:MAG: hypothetical protein K2L74_06745 [Muribaculaceae bacterium]|nr:hypothetical protein [Muribaculaceae bacterium]